MASYREGRPRTSLAWMHFEIKDKEKGIATCNHCHDSFSYRTSVSNLMKHLRGKHGYTSEMKGEEDGNEGDSDNEEKEESKQKIKSEIWEYFEGKDDSAKLASCRLCLDQLSYQTSYAGLMSHLKSKHSIDFGKASDEDEFKGSDDETDGEKMDVSLENMTETRGRGKSSAAWEYFEIKDDVRKVARCNLCGALCSYRTSVSNLMKHARRKHDIGPRTSDGEEERDEEHHDDSKLETSVSRAQRSIVWLYFKCVDSDAKLSQCMICKKLLSHSTTLTNLKKHLERKHPNVKIPVREDGRKRILLSSGGELYEVEAGTKLDDDDDDGDANDDDVLQNDTLEMDTVYLEDFETLEDGNSQKKKTKQPSTKKRVRAYSSSSEEEITFINRYVKKHSDSFDHFGKYIASLLRNLPKETSNKLQTDFVKQILNVEKGAVADKSNSYEIRVPDATSADGFVTVAIQEPEAKSDCHLTFQPEGKTSPITDEYFTTEKGGHLRCSVCGETVSPDEKKTHLFDQHQYNQKNNEGDEDQDNVFTDVVYLEEDDQELNVSGIKKKQINYNNKSSITPKSKVRPSSKRRKIKRSHSESSSDDESKPNNLSSIQNSTINDELEKFGSYIASLLRTVPKSVCTKLQMEIVNKIMAEKLKIDDLNDSQDITAKKEKENSVVEETSEVAASEVAADEASTDTRYNYKYTISGNDSVVENVEDPTS